MNFTTSYQEEFVQALQIFDARNHLFRSVSNHRTDEEQGIYALRDLCVLDDERMCLVPDAGRCRSVARDFGMNR